MKRWEMRRKILNSREAHERGKNAQHGIFISQCTLKTVSYSGNYSRLIQLFCAMTASYFLLFVLRIYTNENLKRTYKLAFQRLNYAVFNFFSLFRLVFKCVSVRNAFFGIRLNVNFFSSVLMMWTTAAATKKPSLATLTATKRCHENYSLKLINTARKRKKILTLFLWLSALLTRIQIIRMYTKNTDIFCVEPEQHNVDDDNKMSREKNILAATKRNSIANAKLPK